MVIMILLIFTYEFFCFFLVYKMCNSVEVKHCLRYLIYSLLLLTEEIKNIPKNLVTVVFTTPHHVAIFKVINS